MQVIAVVGSKNSGKTTTIENLVKELTKKEFEVAVVKHVSQPNFTIDTVGKDTWKFANAGAKTIISVARDEIAKIEKISIKKVSLKKLLKKCEGSDLVIIEGLKKLVATNENIPKIVIVKSKEETNRFISLFKPIIAFSGPYKAQQNILEIPYADGLKNIKKLTKIVVDWLEN